MKSLKFYCQLILILTVTAAVSCAGKKEERAFVSFFAGTASIEREGKASIPVKVQYQVKDGDIIETGDRSYVIIQTDDGIVIRFDSKTRVVFKSISDEKNRELNLDRGKVVSSVSKLKKESEYRVKTPTAVASVRGTEFLTEYDKGKTVVAVGKGKVSVVKTATEEENFVDTGNTAVVAESTDAAVELREISKVEELEISKIQGIPVIDNIEKIDSAAIEEKFSDTEENTEEINQEIEKLLEKDSWTLEKIKAKYGRIDVVTLYNGRVIRGAIIGRGAYVKILTPGGVVTVQGKDIRTTGVM